MFRIFKWFLILLLFIIAAGFVGYNKEIIMQPVSFEMKIPFGDTLYSPSVALGIVFAGCLLIGALVTGFAGLVKIFSQGNQLRKARRRIADLEDEVVSYRGRAASESDEYEDDEEDEEPAY